MIFELSDAQRALQEEVRRFLAENLTPDMRQGQALSAGVYPEPEISGPWHAALARRGWVAPLWPKEHGGPGWSGIERFIFETECALAGAPLIYPIGLRLVGPVLIAFGSESQKRHYLPRILSNEDYWCQGFSEPGAGSDLAALSTRAVRDGDDYVVNGSKIWTTHAHHATHMFTLVRTATSERRQDGISVLLIDMGSPGIEVRPIISMSGEHDVNQVFLENVRVPADALVGEEGRGWTYARYLLELERGAGLFAGRLRSSLKRIEEAAGPALVDPWLRVRLAQVAIDLDCFETMELQTIGRLRPGEKPGAVSSILKLQASRLKQEIAEIAVATLGREAARWSPDIGSIADVLIPDYLNSRAATIFGGAREVQLGIIAKELAAL